jgi:hypothetical protein
LDVLASVTSEYLLNVGRTIRYLSDKYSQTMTPEVCARFCTSAFAPTSCRSGNHSSYTLRIRYLSCTRCRALYLGRRGAARHAPWGPRKEARRRISRGGASIPSCQFLSRTYSFNGRLQSTCSTTRAFSRTRKRRAGRLPCAFLFPYSVYVH